jgi:hypothetical protein
VINNLLTFNTKLVSVIEDVIRNAILKPVHRAQISARRALLNW